MGNLKKTYFVDAMTNRRRTAPIKSFSTYKEARDYSKRTFPNWIKGVRVRQTDHSAKIYAILWYDKRVNWKI